MKLFHKKEEDTRDEQTIAIDFVLSLSDEELSTFREAVNYYRIGDKMQREYYEKGNEVFEKAEKTDIEEEFGEELEDENE